MSNQQNTLVDKDFYRFGLYLNDEIITERVFPADLYNQYTRFSLNIRDIASDMMRNFQSILSSKDSKLDFEDYSYDFLSYYKENNHESSKESSKLINKGVGKIGENNRYVNEDERFKFILFINNNHVIERNFSVKNYNPNARFSINLMNYFEEAVEDIKTHIKNKDVSNMWEEYDLLRTFNLPVDKIRNLSRDEREKLLHKIYSKN